MIGDPFNGPVTVGPLTGPFVLATCNCGALACAANPMGYPPSHGADCPMCPLTERWLKRRIRELETQVVDLQSRVKTGG